MSSGQTPTSGDAARSRAVARPDPITHPTGLSSLWNVPNMLTLLRVALVPVFAWFLLTQDGNNDTYRIISAVIFVFASFTDFLDGYLARKQNLVTTFGKIADPIADKALTGVALIGLSVLGELPWWVTVVILGREIAVTLLRFWVLRHGVIAASRGGKLKTVFQMIAITMYLLPLGEPWDLAKTIMMGLALLLTVATGIDYLVRALRVRSQGKSAAQAGG